MNILLLGSTGLLGQAFKSEIRNRGWAFTDVARSAASVIADVGDLDALQHVLAQQRADLVINCAAMVDVQKCEEDAGAAYRVNARPLAILADWSKSTGKPFLQISTDHYYASGHDRAHPESDPVTFVNEYARSKFAGEAYALSSPHALVLRTSIVGIRGWQAPTFAEWAIRIVEADEPCELFADAFTSSIDVGSFARAALDLSGRREKGLINLAAAEVYSKASFVRELSRQMGQPLTCATVGSVRSLQANRAPSLGLDVGRAERILGYGLPKLEEVVGAVLQDYQKRNKF